jgi:Domain of unknown function (DUF4129)
VTPVSEAAALERLRLILARPELQPDPRPVWERLAGAARDWLAGLIADLLRGVPDAVQGRLGWVQAVVVLAALAAVVALAVYVGRAVRLSVSRDAGRRAAEAARVRARSDALWRDGQALGRDGRYAEACRALYLSALYALEEHELLRVEAGETNREHAERAGTALPALGDTFRVLVRRYDRLRYGHFPVDRAAFEEIADLVAQTRAFRPAASRPHPVVGTGTVRAA